MCPVEVQMYLEGAANVPGLPIFSHLPVNAHAAIAPDPFRRHWIKLICTVHGN
jgi:hypothetical protein